MIGNVEPIVVAYCTKNRNGARIIPDGTITAVQFVKTPLYVQVSGFWDGTKINIPAGGKSRPSLFGRSFFLVLTRPFA